VGILWLLGVHTRPVLFLLLLAALGLTVWEARQQNLDRRLTLWWVSVVGMTHVLGYLALRAWVANRERRS
jgi:membrane protein DedA with SNARE-associated domain